MLRFLLASLMTPLAWCAATPDRLEPWVYPGLARAVVDASSIASGTCTIFRTAPAIDQSAPQVLLAFHLVRHAVGSPEAPATAVWTFLESDASFTGISRRLLPYADALERPCVVAVQDFAGDRLALQPGNDIGYFPHPGLSAAHVADVVKQVRSTNTWDGTITSIPGDLWRASASIEKGGRLTPAQWKAWCDPQRFGRTWARWVVGLPIAFPKQMVTTSWPEWVSSALELATDKTSDADIRLVALGLATEMAAQHPTGIPAGTWKTLSFQIGNISVDRQFHGPFSHACDGSPLQPLPDPAPAVTRLRAAGATIQPLREAAASK